MLDTTRIKIRPYAAEDSRRCCEIGQEVWKIQISQHYSEEAVAYFLNDYVQSTFCSHADQENRKVLVAEYLGEIVGFSMLEFRKEEGEIVHLHVSPPYQRNGIGSRIYRASEAEFLKRNQGNLFAKVAVRSQTIEFWRKQGFATEQRMSGYIPGTEIFSEVELMRKIFST
jgi:ribosomal protein S18 acetylase RimI-like enzyme